MLTVMELFLWMCWHMLSLELLSTDEISLVFGLEDNIAGRSLETLKYVS